jgi:L-ribulokinase
MEDDLPRYALGFDFGTESVRVVIVNIRTGEIAGQASKNYQHGVIDQTLPTSDERLPPDYALQHPLDWLDDAATACKSALRKSDISPDDIIGVGVDFTSCTMLPTLADGTPLC